MRLPPLNEMAKDFIINKVVVYRVERFETCLQPPNMPPTHLKFPYAGGLYNGCLGFLFVFLFFRLKLFPGMIQLSLGEKIIINSIRQLILLDPIPVLQKRLRAVLGKLTKEEIKIEKRPRTKKT